jgi:hypothetical protein
MNLKKISKKEQIKLLEQHLINHSFIIDALIHTLIENDMCTFDELQKKIQKSVKTVETELNNNTEKDDSEIPAMTYYGPIGEA